MSKKNCPYCLSEIVKEAEVCRKCGREVRKIFLLEEELQKAKNEIIRLQRFAGPVPSLPKETTITEPKDGIEISLIVVGITVIFETVFIAFFNINTSIWGLAIYSYFIFLAIGILIFLLLKRNRSFNVWHILIFFAFQPYAVFYLLQFLNPEVVSLSLLINIGRTFYWNTAIVLLFACSLIFLVKPITYKYIFSPRPFFDRVYTPLIKLEGVNKVVLSVISIAATIGVIYKFFFP